jgi:hypothetical protein
MQENTTNNELKTKLWPSYFEGFCYSMKAFVVVLLFYFEGFCCCICYFTLNDIAVVFAILL